MKKHILTIAILLLTKITFGQSDIKAIKVTGTGTDTTKLSARINGKLDIRDTTAMLKKKVPIGIVRAHRIYAMGDSFTEAGVYGSKLESLLGEDWTVISKGKGGDRTEEMLSRFSRDIISNGDAEYVIILGSINDIAQDHYFSSIIGNLQSMYNLAKSAGIKVIAVCTTPFKGNVSFTTTRKATQDSVNNWIMSTATNVDFRVNPYTTLEEGTTDSLQAAYNSGDWMHPSTDGYNALGTYIYNNATFIPSSTIPTLSVSGNSVLNQDVSSTGNPSFISVNAVKNISGNVGSFSTIIMPGVSQGTVNGFLLYPYFDKLKNSPIYTNGTNVSIGFTSQTDSKVEVYGNGGLNITPAIKGRVRAGSPYAFVASGEANYIGGEVGYYFTQYNSVNALTEYGGITTEIVDNTNGSEIGSLNFYVKTKTAPLSINLATLNGIDSSFNVFGSIIGKTESQSENSTKLATTAFVKQVSQAKGASGQTALVSGTKVIPLTGVTTGSTATLGFVSIGGTVSTTWQYSVVCTANTVTITALTNSGTTNTGDTSTLNYSIVY
jgi:lysophospholipase L1-like esterase